MELLGKVATTLTAVVMLVVVVMGEGGEESCSPAVVSKVEKRLYYSDAVVLGKVVQTLPEPGQPEMYRVQMEVYCIYKGQNVPSMIDIWEAGNVTEPCSERRMEVDGVYVAYLYKHAPNVYTPAFPRHLEGYKDEVAAVCDINITKLAGEEENNVTCEAETPEYEYEEDKEDNNCFRYNPKPGDSAHGMVKKPRNLSGKTEKAVEGEGDADPSNGSGSAGSVSASLLLSSALALGSTVCTLLCQRLV